MRVAVVGHVEWVEFARVPAVPAPGAIVHAGERWEEPAGGGGVAAAELARLGAEAHLFTALGSDALGHRAHRELEELGVHVHARQVEEPQRRAWVHVDETGERTITVLGDKLLPRGGDGDLPWELLAGADAVYFVAGDPEALRRARRAPVLTATARELATLRRAGEELEALVASGTDDGERYADGDLDPPPRLVVTTAGPLGGWSRPGGPFRAAPPPPEREDAYGCGDCFAAGLTLALGRGDAPHDAVAFAAERGAAALGRRGAHGRPPPG